MSLMTFPNVKAVCFDAVGTLIRPHPSAGTVYHQIGSAFGSRLDETTIRRRFRDAFAAQELEDIQHDLRTSEERERRRWLEIVAAVLDDLTDSDACFQQLYKHFGKPTAWRCADSARVVLEELARSGLRLAMASNYDHRLRSVMEGLEELLPISHLIISSEVGWRKPAAEFFNAVSEELELPPNEIVFVGDDTQNDYRGAKQAGFPAILYDPANDGSIMADRITDLHELLPIFTGTSSS